MSIHSPERRRKKRKRKKTQADMHTCINPKHLEAAVNMINGLRRGKRRRPARPVLHGGSQSHRVGRLHTLHGDLITSCSLDAADESLLLKQRLCIHRIMFGCCVGGFVCDFVLDTVCLYQRCVHISDIESAYTRYNFFGLISGPIFNINSRSGQPCIEHECK